MDRKGGLACRGYKEKYESEHCRSGHESVQNAILVSRRPCVLGTETVTLRS